MALPIIAITSTSLVESNKLGRKGAIYQTPSGSQYILGGSGTLIPATRTNIDSQKSVYTTEQEIAIYNDVLVSMLTASSTYVQSVSGTIGQIDSTGGVNPVLSFSANAINGLLPDQTGHGGEVLGSDGTNVSWVTVSGSVTIGAGQIGYGDSLGNITSDSNMTWDATNKVFNVGDITTTLNGATLEVSGVGNYIMGNLYYGGVSANAIEMSIPSGSLRVNIGDTEAAGNGTTFVIDDATQSYTFNSLNGASDRITKVDISGVLGIAVAGTDYVTPSGVETLSNKTIGNTNTVTLKDTLFTLQDDADTTKQARFQLSGITTGTTRTYTLPNASSTLVDLVTVQSITNKTLDNTNTVTLLDSLFTLQDNGNNTRQMNWQLSGITAGNTRTITAVDYSGTSVLSNGALTANRIPYYTSSGLADNATLTWDNTNNSVKVGTTTGSATTPHLAVGSTNNGLYLSASNTPSISVAGTKRVSFTSAGNIKIETAATGVVGTASGNNATQINLLQADLNVITQFIGNTTGAYSQFQVLTPGGSINVDNVEFDVLGSGYASSGVYANSSCVMATRSALTNGFRLGNEANAPIIFFTGGLGTSDEKARIDSTGLTTSVGLNVTNSSVDIQTDGYTVKIKEGGGAACMGVGTLSSGAVTISTTAVTATSRIFAFRTDPLTSTAIGDLCEYVPNRIPGTSFDIFALTFAGTSIETNDVSDFCWILFEPS